MSYLHEKNIIHRDLKLRNFYFFLPIILENILFAKKGNVLSIKLIDFGLSAKLRYDCHSKLLS